MTTFGDLMRGKIPDELLKKIVRKQKYLHEIEIEFESPVAKWGKHEWKAVATIALDKLFALTDKHSSYKEISDEMFKEIKQLRKSYRLGGTGKKGKVYEPKASIQRAVNALGNRSLDKVLRYLENDKNCEEIYQAGGVMFDKINRERKVLIYYDSTRDPDIPQALKFKRLRNILSEIK